MSVLLPSGSVPLKMVFLDAGGTLFGVRGNVGEIYSQVARRYGMQIEPELLQRAFSRHFHQQPPLAFAPELAAAQLAELEKTWWRQLVRDVFAEAGEFARFAEFFAELFEFFRSSEAWQLYDDVVPALTALKACGLRLAVISNFDARLTDILRAFNLLEFFEAIYLSARIGAAKPDPRIFQAALQAHDLLPSEAVHVGDSLHEDVQGAAAVGLHSVWLARDDDKAVANDVTRIARLTQLPELCGCGSDDR